LLNAIKEFLLALPGKKESNPIVIKTEKANGNS
jgi:hypothetical protein